ncbi:hypothetical protein CWE13_08360 [Aliidiomarina shirensis]|uniref:Uncharacterized protein n=1 Tax=Aliidiomarina shirensis TaxID=1048642 RepID=A0A432WSV1_9GAMM|nr:hypothetical protein [Aliidiomarina shirensis]RUO36850.1 hypothetical protein CWE13_08360 [Aliidiomarina shirensis]
MKKIQLLALAAALIAIAVHWLMQAQASMSAAPSGGVLLFAALISLPLLVASAVFSIGSTIVLCSAEKRAENGINTPFWYCIFISNIVLSALYLYVFATFVYSFI